MKFGTYIFSIMIQLLPLLPTKHTFTHGNTPCFVSGRQEAKTKPYLGKVSSYSMGLGKFDHLDC